MIVPGVQAALGMLALLGPGAGPAAVLRHPRFTAYALVAHLIEMIRPGISSPRMVIFR